MITPLILCHQAGPAPRGGPGRLVPAPVPAGRRPWPRSCADSSRPRRRSVAGPHAPVGALFVSGVGGEEDAMTNTRIPINRDRLREGLQVYSDAGRLLGPIERIDADSITVKGQRYHLDAIER